jgi:hypothetical protein
MIVPLLALALLAVAPPRGNGPGRAPSETSSAAAAGLWQKAVAIQRRNRDWYPERITILSELLNRHDEPYSITQIFFSLHRGADGQLHTELTRSLKNGEDTTEKMRSKVTIGTPGKGMDTDNENTYSVSISDSPFDPERQGAVSFRTSGEKRLLFGHSCHRFEFTYQTTIVRKGEIENLTWSGMAWLEEESGLPVKLEFSLDPLPGLIRSLWAIYLYETARPDQWVLRKVTISGHGGFLFIKKRFRSTTTFSHYRRPPQKGAAK